MFSNKNSIKLLVFVTSGLCSTLAIAMRRAPIIPPLVPSGSQKHVEDLTNIPRIQINPEMMRGLQAEFMHQNQARADSLLRQQQQMRPRWDLAMPAVSELDPSLTSSDLTMMSAPVEAKKGHIWDRPLPGGFSAMPSGAFRYTRANLFRATAPLLMTRQEALQALGVDEGASQQAIKTAYRQKAKISHPDVAGGSHQKFLKVNEAYDILRGASKPSEPSAPKQDAGPTQKQKAGQAQEQKTGQTWQEYARQTWQKYTGQRRSPLEEKEFKYQEADAEYAKAQQKYHRNYQKADAELAKAGQERDRKHQEAYAEYVKAGEKKEREHQRSLEEYMQANFSSKAFDKRMAINDAADKEYGKAFDKLMATKDAADKEYGKAYDRKLAMQDAAYKEYLKAYDKRMDMRAAADKEYNARFQEEQDRK
jgi:curved DNA-binding protein CbpA